MSGGHACNCEERRKPVKQRNWRVLVRKCNYSAFAGYSWTPSDYSAIRCMSCRQVWRTKASYVDLIHDATQEERLRP